METKKIKNPESPLGRKDWEGRNPRRRMNFLHSQLVIIKEWADAYFLKYPDKKLDREYLELYERMCGHIEEIQKPLTKSVHSFPLFEQEWDYDG